MTDGIEAVTRSMLALALDAASLRQQVIATNIANVNTVGYVRQKVTFEARIAAARQDLEIFGATDAVGLDRFRPRIEPALSDEGGVQEGVQLDTEAADMARNAVQYQALIKGLSRQLSILSTAVSDGRK